MNEVSPSGSTIDIIFNLFKVRYICMTELFKKLELKNVNTVNFFINLESVYKGLHRDSFEQLLSTCTKDEINNNYKCFISNIINLAAHYRQYFTRARVTSNIIFYCTDLKADPNMMTNHIYNKRYRKDFMNSYVYGDRYEITNGMINEGITYAKTICDYIDRVFLITSPIVEASVIPYLLKNNQRLKPDLNIILTKDNYDLQYVNHKCIILWPNKDESIILTKSNIMSFLRYKNEMDEDKVRVNLSTSLIPFILSVLGDKKRGMEKVSGIGFKKLYKGLESLYLDDFISDEVSSSMSLESLLTLVKSSKGFREINVKETIGNNYYCTDLERQNSILNQTSKMLIEDQIVNKYDNNNLKKLNDKVFNEYPFQLQELNNYERRSKKDPFGDYVNFD